MTESRGANHTDLGNPIPGHRAYPKDPSGDHLAASIGSTTRGRLRFTNGAHQFIIRSESRMQDLYRARFGDRMPTVGARRGVVTVQYTRFPTSDWPDYRSERPAEIVLNQSISWDIEVHGGASRLVADLRALQLRSLRLDGGASRLEVMLPAPSGTVTILILGGASNIAIRCPEGVSTRLCVEGGVTNLRFHERHIGAAGGALDLRSREYEDALARYDVAVTGGANNVSIDSEGSGS